MKKMYCTICKKIILGDDYFKDYGFIHHRTCHERVYGLEFDD